jgi:hypothetical protein
MTRMTKTHDATRRALLKKAAYAAPAVLTLQATSAVAKAGSQKEQATPKKSKKAKKKKTARL